jgi:cbb3-type cytochrome oxidase maturation protein
VNVLVCFVLMALTLGLTGLVGFLWSMRTGQWRSRLCRTAASVDADQQCRRQSRVHCSDAKPEDTMAATYGAQRQPAMQRYLKDIVYGANDGIVTTLVVIASVTGASMSTAAVLVLGIANLIADGFSMGTSNVLSTRSTLTAETRPRLAVASRNA